MQTLQLCFRLKPRLPLLYSMVSPQGQYLYSSHRNVSMSVTPASCLHDEEVSIKVTGLEASQSVTLCATMKDVRGCQFFSYAHYSADNSGCVDLNTAVSQGGHYVGLFPMGLMACMHPAPSEKSYLRFFKRDVENPNEVKLKVFGGHLNEKSLFDPQSSSLLASVDHLRHYMAPGVKRIPVKQGKVRGALFMPPGDGPFPGVIDMFGTAGGLLEYRAAQMASRGIASLALAFFAYDDLVEDLEFLDITYFEEAVHFLLSQDKVQKSGVGSVGVSKGADIALSMATFIPEVTAAVSINGCCSNSFIPMKLKDSIFPHLSYDASRIKLVGEGVSYCKDAFEDPRKVPEAIIPIAEANAEFLFLVCEDDLNWKSEEFADVSEELFKSANKTNIEIHRYPGAGHLLEPPYSPFCFASLHKVVGGSIIWGGQPKEHTHAQVVAWKVLIEFFKKHLTVLRGKL